MITKNAGCWNVTQNSLAPDARETVSLDEFINPLLKRRISL